MRVAGLGCRKGCPPEPIVTLVQQAVRQLGGPIDALATAEFKRQEPGLQAAATYLSLPLLFVTDAALAAAQPLCPTRSETALRSTGHASVAEAAALAASGGPLLLSRIGDGPATCAIAGPPLA